MKIAIDIDNVLNNHVEKTIEFYNKKYNKSLSMQDINHYSIYECLPYEDADNFIKLFTDIDVLNSLTPTNRSQACLKSLINQGHELYIATATPPQVYDIKVNFIKKYFDFFPVKNMICIQKKSLLNVDILIDDSLEQLTSSVNYYRVCYDQPWNQGHDYAYDIYRAYSWDDVLTCVDKICKRDKE